jgi:prepilin-type processing-associated H-X9-DG protein
MHQIMREDYKIVQKQTLCPSFQGWLAGTFDNPWDKNNDTAQLTYMWMVGWGSRPASPIGNVQIGNIDTGWLKGTYPSYTAGFRPAMWLKRGISLPPNQHPMMFDVNYVNRPQVDMPNTANHLLPNGLPEGANTLFADGHVEYLMVRIGESWELMNVNHYWSPSFAKPAAASLMTTFDN